MATFQSEAAAGTSKAAPPEPGRGPAAAQPAVLRRWLAASAPFLAGAFMLVLAGLAAAWWLPLRADIHTPPAFLSPAWWLAPQETNAFARVAPPMSTPRPREQQQQQQQQRTLPPAIVVDETSGKLQALARQPGGPLALAVGRDGAIWRSVDSGRTWHPTPKPSLDFITSVAIAAGSGTAYAVGSDLASGRPEDAAIVQRSDDGGRSWRGTGFRATVPMSLTTAANGATALVAGGDIGRTTDGGRSWASQRVGTETTLNVSIAIDRAGAVALVGGERGRLLRSADGGATWSPVQSGMRDVRAVAISADGRTELVLGNGSSVLESRDGANRRATALTEGEEMWALSLSPDGRIALVGGQHGLGWRRVGAGDWEPISFGTTAEIRSLAVNDDGTALALGAGETILRSTDGGRTWSMPPHGASPAPIAWVLMGASLFAILPAFRPIRREVVAEADGGIAGLFATDRPLRTGDADAAGAGALAERISRFLRNRHTEPPLTLAIIGPWGTGKSSVLNRLVADLKRHGLRPVWFNAWHHQKEEHLFAALLEQVRSQAVPPMSSRAGIEVRWRLFLGRLRRDFGFWLALLLFCAFAAGLLAASDWPRPQEAWDALQSALGGGGKGDWKTALSGLTPVLAAVGAVWKFVTGFGDRLKSSGLDPGRLMAATAGVTGAKALGAQLAFRVRFAEALGEVASALGDRTLTVVVDDLDRCRPEQVAEAMEAINFLTSAAGCFVVLGIAREQVLLAMGLAHKDMAKEMAQPGLDEREARTRYAENYLQKLVQIEVPVPAFDAAAAARLVAAARTRPAGAARGQWRGAAAGVAVTVAIVLAFALGVAMHRTVAPVPQLAAGGTAAPSGGQNGGQNGGANTAPVAPATGGRSRPPVVDAQEVARVAASPLSLLAGLGLVGAALAVAGAAAWVQARRREQVVVEDAPEFARALDHWAHAAFLAQPSPRQMKRFLNRLRFVAAMEDMVLSGPTVVGLGVLAHASPQALQAFATGDGSPYDGLDEPVREALLEAALSTREAGLPKFDPRRAEARAFLAMWRGLTVRG